MPFNDTANRGYPLPDPLNRLDEDVLRLMASLNAIDADVASLFASMTGKASATHGHVIADVAGLQAALDAKLGAGTAFALDDLSDVSATGVQANMFLRWSGTAWVPVVLDGAMVVTGTINGARLGTHAHAISDVSGLQASLDGKQAAGSYAAASHTHTIANVTGLQTALDAKLDDSEVGTGANQLVRLNGSSQLPAVSGALLTNLPIPAATGRLLRAPRILSSGTSYTTPAECTSIYAELVGGGGGGGGSAGASNPAGGGGGAGAYAAKLFTVTQSTAYTYAIGGAGNAGSSAPNPGGSGGNTTFTVSGTTVTAGGGSGGGTTGRGGAGGTATNGDINVDGNAGGTGGPGNALGGSGSGTYFGGGGRGGSGGAGAAGVSGGGGGGAGGNGFAGGAGGAGIIRIWEFS